MAKIKYKSGHFFNLEFCRNYLAEIFDPSVLADLKYLLLTERLHFCTGYAQSIVKATKKSLKTILGGYHYKGHSPLALGARQAPHYTYSQDRKALLFLSLSTEWFDRSSSLTYKKIFTSIKSTPFLDGHIQSIVKVKNKV